VGQTFYRDTHLYQGGFPMQSDHADYAYSYGGVFMSGSDGTDCSTRVPVMRYVWVPAAISCYHQWPAIAIFSQWWQVLTSLGLSLEICHVNSMKSNPKQHPLLQLINILFLTSMSKLLPPFVLSLNQSSPNSSQHDCVFFSTCCLLHSHLHPRHLLLLHAWHVATPIP
jgi:hypothetical protein